MPAILENAARANESGYNRDQQIQNVLNEVRALRAAGDPIQDADVIAHYSDLQPELGAALVLLKKIESSLRCAVNVGEVDPRKPADTEASASSLPSMLPTITGYRLIQSIDRGGQAAIFLAIQESTGRKVAIKVLDGGAFITSRKQERFEREVKALVAIDHPGIVRIVDRGRTIDGSFFIAMDYVDGEDLDIFLERKRGEEWTSRDVAELFAKIAAAIGEAHRLGIIHRDIKPSNIRIDARGEPRILDFGLARLTAKTDDERVENIVTQTGGVVGSLPWASPEQASGDSAKLCAASDVYSLGVVLYRALAGRSPYDLTGTIRQQIHNICEVKPRFPIKSETWLPFGSIDPALVGVILKCLEKHSGHRYCDGIALAEELNDYLSGRLQRFPARFGRRRSILAVTAIVAALGVSTALTMNFRGSYAAAVQNMKLPTIKNSIGMEMVLIPAGTFRAGSPESENGHHPNEEPHKVTLTHSYYIGRTEITRAEYLRVMGSLPADIVSVHGDDQLPVDYISRDQAEEFCRRLSRIEGRHYRLPAEAEWENACRAGTDTPFSGTGRIDDVAWYAGNSGGQLQPVSSKQANAWGICDMEGNVSEWCADQFISHLDRNSVIDPFAPPEPQTKGVVRGGSYQLESAYSRAAARIQLNPNTRMKGIGFRAAMDVAAPSRGYP